MARLAVKGWAEFQHYKHRSPPWIKLHRGLLDNYDYQTMQLASRALAPMFWLLASESADGTFDADPVKLSFRLRTTEKIVASSLSELIDKGFLVDASEPLAERKQDACLETERETEKETESTLLGKPNDEAPEEKKKREAKERRESAKRIIDFLNKKTGRAYQHSDVFIEMICARLMDGATEQDCKSIIARKYMEWGSDEVMSKYVRPQTLFNRSKFANYVGELVAPQSNPWDGAK